MVSTFKKIRIVHVVGWSSIGTIRTRIMGSLSNVSIKSPLVLR